MELEKKKLWEQYAAVLLADKSHKQRLEDLQAIEQALKDELERTAEEEDTTSWRDRLGLLREVRRTYLEDNLKLSENPYHLDPDAKRLKSVDQRWQEGHEDRVRKHRKDYQPPWVKSGEPKEDWETRKQEEVREAGSRWRKSRTDKWDRKSDEEKRKAIKLAAQFGKYQETRDEPLPQSEESGMRTEWFESFLIPQDIIRAGFWVGFHTDLLVERLETARSEFQTLLDTRGVAALLERKKDLENQLELRQQAIGRNEKRSEELVYRKHPNPEDSQFRALDLLAANSVASAFFEPKDEIEEELATISRQQQANIEDQHALRFHLCVLINVLERSRRGLPKSWDPLYDRWRVDDKELERLYADYGVPEAKEPSQNDLCHFLTVLKAIEEIGENASRHRVESRSDLTRKIDELFTEKKGVSGGAVVTGAIRSLKSVGAPYERWPGYKEFCNLIRQHEPELRQLSEGKRASSFPLKGDG